MRYQGNKYTKCINHPEADAVETRPRNNTNFIERSKQKHCVKLTVGGVMGIVTGVIGFSAGIRLITVDWANAWFGFGMLALGIMAVVGSSFAFARKYFGLAIVGGICAMLVMLPLLFYVIGVIGIVPLILIATSRKQFKM